MIFFLLKDISQPSCQSLATRIISIFSEHEKLTLGPSIDETERLKEHGTIIGFRTKDILE
jgi:hypothetical protein